MAEDESAGEKTEDATPHRLRKLREKGQVPKSRDLSAAAVLLGAMLLLRYGGSTMLRGVWEFMEDMLSRGMAEMVVPVGNEIMPYCYRWLTVVALTAGPFLLALLVVALAVNFAQVGFYFSTESLTLDLDKLNPVNNMQRIFSLQGVMMLVMNLMKLAVVVTVAYLSLKAELPAAAMLTALGPEQIFIHGAYAVSDLGVKLAMIFFILGLADMGYQSYQYAVNNRMTKQEIREEYKETEGDPHVRAKRRQIQRQMAMKRMMQEVPQAEVVVRNPTHYAVAIKYKPEMAAPEVVAKGADHLALRIIEVAIKNQVPVWQAPALARQLYNVDLGKPVPAALFPALAEVLAMVLGKEKKASLLKSIRKNAAAAA